MSRAHTKRSATPRQRTAVQVPISVPDDPLAGRLVVRPQEAWMIIGCGHSKGWDLVKQRQLEAIRIGGMTLITTRSIRELLGISR